MNYNSVDGKIVSNDEIINLINEKLYKIQNQLFDRNSVDINMKLLKLMQTVRMILTALTILLCLITLINFKIIYIICAIIGIVAILSISIIINIKTEKEQNASKKSNQTNNEAIILQDVRAFLLGKITSNEAILKKLNELSKEIINKRNGIN